ncbi:MAG: nicotinate-nucleotide--dimethylbenzimidazole phosphoribosyltransferase [Oscillospiraceae bacterium]|jgi:nicotinate-nucleotide--dimethylbenzimidazole phosphoribosyltransferase|nr:nicotinate-nucleotide--dimethylbenzimidazole phosphoribosyltransferase [Oscillospiraceae bacterium]
MDFEKINSQIPDFNQAAADEAAAHWNNCAKPVGSLGELEALLIRIAGVTGSAAPDFSRRAVVIVAADNGVVTHGIASTPPEITVTMSGFMAKKRSSVCIMAKAANCDSYVVDMGCFKKLPFDGIIDRHISDGTADISVTAAMSRGQCEQAVQAGIDLVRDFKFTGGYKILATGEMGIGNTTTSSAIASVLLQRTPAEVTGRGAGLTDDALERKIKIVEKAISVNRVDPLDPFDVLRKLGGYDIAAMVGLFLGGALYSVPIVVDGFISAVAAYTARRLCPKSYYAMVASHVSAEPAAKMILSALELNAVIHAGMRLGEGTGAVAIFPLLDMAAAVYRDLMTFADIGM